MFFITTAAIAGTTTAGAWLIHVAPLPAALCAVVSGVASAAVAAALVAWIDRPGGAARPDAPPDPAAERAPDLPRGRLVRLHPLRSPHHHRPGRNGGRRFASAP
ncbi:hypothetical protein VQ02_08980 [Methylobacterium variabile]|jgi:hypothetical protein|uniref:Uncharacterized protein n=1 Tax=Methylobacterium variabile TaxID=298794 RepID=A0A0J6T288_9HYPH|nr:hypothetical protein [Methylobacterium variabile]KMO39967.1 hypothetical protein VQ02_08980 [Methylobacterium variabile]